MVDKVSDELAPTPTTVKRRLVWSLVYIALAGVQWLIGLGMSAAAKRAWPELYR